MSIHGWFDQDLAIRQCQANSACPLATRPSGFGSRRTIQVVATFHTMEARIDANLGRVSTDLQRNDQTVRERLQFAGNFIKQAQKMIRDFLPGYENILASLTRECRGRTDFIARISAEIGHIRSTNELQIASWGEARVSIMSAKFADDPHTPRDQSGTTGRNLRVAIRWIVDARRKIRQGADRFIRSCRHLNVVRHIATYIRARREADMSREDMAILSAAVEIRETVEHTVWWSRRVAEDCREVARVSLISTCTRLRASLSSEGADMDDETERLCDIEAFERDERDALRLDHPDLESIISGQVENNTTTSAGTSGNILPFDVVYSQVQAFDDALQAECRRAGCDRAISGSFTRFLDEFELCLALPGSSGRPNLAGKSRSRLTRIAKGLAGQFAAGTLPDNLFGRCCQEAADES